MDSTAYGIILLSLVPFLVYRLTKRFILFELAALVAVVVHGIVLYGTPVLWVLAATYAISTAAEVISLKTPLSLFGVKYWYTDGGMFSPKLRLFGVYPLEVSLAWVLFKYLSMSVTAIIITAFSLPSWVFLFGIPLVLVSIDILIDPVAVNHAKLWSWQRGSRFFGIPWQNFIGWYGVGLLSTVILYWCMPKTAVEFHYILLLPVFLYGSLISHARTLLLVDKKMTVVALLPVLTWTIVSFIGIYILYQRV